jgi:hypothetical protein
MKADLAAVDRKATPWVVGLVHKDWTMEAEAYAAFSPILQGGKVDVLFVGHVHYYNRYMPYDSVTGDVDTASVSADGSTYTNPKYMITIVTGASGDRELDSSCKDNVSPSYTCSQNYGYGFLYHSLEWQCVASGLEPGVGIVHKLRRSRPSLVCDLVEPFRCCVELTVIRHLDEMHDKKKMAGRYAEMLEETLTYRGHRFRLRSIIRLVVESFVQALDGKKAFEPFALQPRDACV